MWSFCCTKASSLLIPQLQRWQTFPQTGRIPPQSIALASLVIAEHVVSSVTLDHICFVGIIRGADPEGPYLMTAALISSATPVKKLAGLIFNALMNHSSKSKFQSSFGA